MMTVAPGESTSATSRITWALRCTTSAEQRRRRGGGRSLPGGCAGPRAAGGGPPADPRFVIDPIAARVSGSKAATVLGFQAVVARPRAMELTLAWARDAGIVPAAMHEDLAA